MAIKIVTFIAFVFFSGQSILAQQDSIPRQIQDSLHFQGNLQLETPNTLNILSPAKAAFYSAVLPGLGQAYNKQYWKIPLVYGAMGAGVYFYLYNNNEYLKYRTAYFNRKKGIPDEFPDYGTDVLVNAQKIFKRERDMMLMLTVLAYFLNIVDANVSAHLKQWNVDDNLSFSPVGFQVNNRQVWGVKFSFKSKY